jgi:hypothetical protein
VSAAGRFFPLALASFLKACDIGLHEAVALLLLTSGRRGKGLSTRWGVHAVETYGGLSRRQARHAIQALEAADLVSPVEGQTRRLMDLPGPALWMPQTFIHGAAGEPSPLVRLRETGDVLTLRLAVHLYDRHLVDPEDNGLPLTLYRREWTKTVLVAYRDWQVCAFQEDMLFTNCADDSLMAPYVVPANKTAKRNLDGFWTRMDLLKGLGLLRPVLRLMESAEPEAVEVHSLAPSHIVPVVDVAIEADVATAAERAAAQLLDADDDAYARYRDMVCDRTVLLPVRAHMTNAALVTGWRLAYRPHTEHTKRWLAELDATCRAAVADYARVTDAWGGVSDASRLDPQAASR